MSQSNWSAIRTALRQWCQLVGLKLPAVSLLLPGVLLLLPGVLPSGVQAHDVDDRSFERHSVLFQVDHFFAGNRPLSNDHAGGSSKIILVAGACLGTCPSPQVIPLDNAIPFVSIISFDSFIPFDSVAKQSQGLNQVSLKPVSNDRQSIFRDVGQQNACSQCIRTNTPGAAEVNNCFIMNCTGLDATARPVLSNVCARGNGNVPVSLSIRLALHCGNAGLTCIENLEAFAQYDVAGDEFTATTLES